MNISQAAAWAITKLKYKTKNPHLEAEILLSHVLKKPREYLLAHPEKKLTKKQISNIQSLISKRLEGAPIAYLTGYKYFYGLKFFVNKNTLIPRPETELMVEEAIRVSHNAKHVTIVDVGTGSGCIIITLAKNIQYPVSNIQYLATDISKYALAVARQNAKLHQVDKKITFFQGNLLKPILKYFKNSSFDIRHSTFVITANLPYLTPTQIKKSPSIKHEPKLAINAGKDGLKYYRRLFKQIKTLGDKRYAIRDMRYAIRDTRYAIRVARYALCEIDPSQTQKIKQLIKKEFSQSQTQIKKDLRGLNRLVIVKI